MIIIIVKMVGKINLKMSKKGLCSHILQGSQVVLPDYIVMVYLTICSYYLSVILTMNCAMCTVDLHRWYTVK